MIKMTDLLPLRQTTVWGGYREKAFIPHRYGPCSGMLLQYDATRTLWVFADHPCTSVDEVLLGGADAPEWEWYVGQDSTGTAITFVRFNDQIDEGAQLFARGRGKLHPTTGEPLITAGNVCWDVLVNLCGWTIEQARFNAIDREVPYTIGGSLETAEKVQVILRSLADSCGMIFAIDSPGLLYAWPPTDVSKPRYTIVQDMSIGLSARADDAALYNDLTIQFQHEQGVPQQAVRFTSPSSAGRYGEIAAPPLEARWLVRQRDAVDLVQRMLRYAARPLWDLAAGGLPGVRNIGDVIAVNHPLLGLQGAGVVTAREVDFIAGRSQINFTVPAGDIPSVELVSQSAAYAPNSYVGATVTTIGTDRIIQLTEADGAPMVNAAVALELDGQVTVRYTDSAGRVAFPAYLMPPGNYVLQITTADGLQFDYFAVIT